MLQSHEVSLLLITTLGEIELRKLGDLVLQLLCYNLDVFLAIVSLYINVSGLSAL